LLLFSKKKFFLSFPFTKGPLAKNAQPSQTLAMNVCSSALGAVLFFCGPAHAASPAALPDMAGLAARVMPAVVSIASTEPVNGGAQADNSDGGGDDSAFRAQRTSDDSGAIVAPPKAVEALGSGFVFDPAGYIVTNNHVIDGAASVTVTFQDGTILPAVVVGRDKPADLAVLKVNAGHPLPALPFGDSSKMQVGDWVMAIGNPFGLPGSTSAGIVSALDRNIQQDTYDDFIQTDATINRGNSGGPLFNMAGQVIGVDAAIYSPGDSGGSVGVGFAIPAAMVAPVAAALKTTGEMTRGWLGVATQGVTPAIEQSLSLPDGNGALIGGVSAGSPADGVLQPGDVLTSLAGVKITDTRSLFIRTAEIAAGQKTEVTFWRGGREQDATLRLAVPPAQGDDTITPATPAAAADVKLPGLGLSVAAAPANHGVKITAVTAKSAAAGAGIVAGDLIEQLAGQTTATAADLQAQLKTLTAPVAVLLVSGDAADGADPGPRWVTVVLAGKK
jgi:serine protease Do/2-alkenal reductase